MAQQDGPGVLSGLRIADFSRVLAGPYATMMLADFGADVIKVEPPGGDETRGWVPPVDGRGESAYFGAVNRNKRSLTLDLHDAAQRQRARALVASADVVVDNFRPGVMARFGLDHETLRQADPRLISCTITGFGEASALPGYDVLVQAVGGLMSITGHPDAEPAKVGVALVDVLSGQNAVAGILLALRERDRTGRGQHVQISLLQSLLSALTNQAASVLAGGPVPGRLGNAHPSIAPYAVFPAADRDLVIAVGNDRQHRALCGVVGIDPEDPRFRDNESRVRNRAALTRLLEHALQADPAASWVARLSAVGVPAGLVNDIGEALRLADRLGLAPVVTTGGVRSVSNPIGLRDSPARYDRPPPQEGEHADARWERSVPARGERT
ncbi:CaiB/BaiF CoA-transferase family protein [Microbacterium sp. MYb62]|uniref:CaiB/BaiF CoA transferase family protein n=1 Tax=Microbacterium sp. MYb62 TaxID=1848690 RepID=UPI000CFC38DD|nr:CoA transferase [Microbacterium sp. MYb62]PRB07771.1 carnitine dehydratase [Microbacterium sp. MYb62]